MSGKAEVASAKLVRELGISACARQLGITPQALRSGFGSSSEGMAEPWS